MKTRKERWYYIYDVNCDCGSYKHAWGSEVHSGEFHRCIDCKKQLGDMELYYIGKVKAFGDIDALGKIQGAVK